MGVERAVTLWYVHRQSILNEITLLETRIVEIEVSTLVSNILVSTETSEGSMITELSEVSVEVFSAVAKPDLEQQLAKARMKLHAMGPCPKPMMG